MHVDVCMKPAQFLVKITFLIGNYLYFQNPKNSNICRIIRFISAYESHTRLLYSIISQYGHPICQTLSLVPTAPYYPQQNMLPFLHEKSISQTHFTKERYPYLGGAILHHPWYVALNIENIFESTNNL